ncbi:MAG: FHA domain-containing protein [Streptosporangiales bacterium]|nr:FHA domain-containing protein [Streptosporangiales bacterium]
MRGSGSSDSLARGVPPAGPGTLFAQSAAGGIKVAPRPGQTVWFGRGIGQEDEGPDVDLYVGKNDLYVSRRHGELTFRNSHWWLRNTGQQLIRLPRDRWMHQTTEPVPLASGYTPLFVKGSGHREHLVELYVTDEVIRRHGRPPGSATLPPKRWPLSDEERLVLVALGQEYLHYKPDPQPLSYQQAYELLDCLRPGEGWTEATVRHRVDAVRYRLDRSGDFPYPVREEERRGAPDNRLKHNLLKGLVESTTLTPPDLGLLDDGLDD